MAGNPFSARASFQVQDPNVAANALLNAGINLEQTNRRNFQSGLNNAITQAAAIQRQKQVDQAKMARQLEDEQFRRDQLASQQAFAREQRSELLKQKAADKASDVRKLMDFENISLQKSQNLAQHKQNLLTIRADIIKNATTGGNLNSDVIKSELGKLDKELEAADVALGLNELERNQVQLSAGVTGINGEVPVSEQTSFESAGQGAFTSGLRPDEMTGLEPEVGQQEQDLTFTPQVDPEVQAIADSFKLQFNLKRAKTIAEIAENRGDTKKIQDLIEVPNKIRSIGQELGTTEDEKFLFDDIADRVDLVTADESGSKQYGKDRQAYFAPGGRAMVGEVIKVSDDLREQMMDVIEAGGTIRGFDTNAIQALTQRIAGGDSEGALAIMNKQLEEGFIGKRGKLSREQADALSRSMFANYRKMLGPLTSVNRTLFNSVGTQTEGDMDRAIGFLIPIGSSAETSFDNLDNAIGTFEGLLIQNDAYYGNIKGAKRQFKKYKDEGYSFDELGSSVRVDD